MVLRHACTLIYHETRDGRHQEWRSDGIALQKTTIGAKIALEKERKTWIRGLLERAWRPTLLRGLAELCRARQVRRYRSERCPIHPDWFLLIAGSGPRAVDAADLQSVFYR